jgi:hypothetical protein
VEDLSFLRYRRGGSIRYFGSVLGATAASTVALTANRLYGLPFFLPISMRFDRIAINVTTLAAGNARLGIYADGGAVAPVKLILDAGTVSTGTTGVKEITITQALSGKLHWLAIVSDAGATIRGGAAGSLFAGFFGTDSTLPTTWDSYVYRAFTYAALPDPWGTPTITSGTMPLIFLRKV